MARRVILSMLAGCMAVCLPVGQASAQNKIRFGWCSNTYSVAIAQFAVAQKKGWFKDNNVDISLFTFGGSIDCARNIATGELDVALIPVIEYFRAGTYSLVPNIAIASQGPAEKRPAFAMLRPCTSRK